jgi:hypothetical protein
MSNCPCAKPLPTYPDVDQWAPLLWRILHSLAEHSGEIVSPLFADDEKRQWVLFVQMLPNILPCPHCREHAQDYLKTHPFAESVKPISSTKELHTFLVDYFYTFHEAVNTRLGKPSFDKTLLTSTYRGIAIRKELENLHPIQSTAIQLSGLRILDWKKWVGYLRMILSFYGL